MSTPLSPLNLSTLSATHLSGRSPDNSVSDRTGAAASAAVKSTASPSSRASRRSSSPVTTNPIGICISDEISVMLLAWMQEKIQILATVTTRSDAIARFHEQYRGDRHNHKEEWTPLRDLSLSTCAIVFLFLEQTRKTTDILQRSIEYCTPLALDDKMRCALTILYQPQEAARLLVDLSQRTALAERRMEQLQEINKAFERNVHQLTDAFSRLVSIIKEGETGATTQPTLMPTFLSGLQNPLFGAVKRATEFRDALVDWMTPGAVTFPLELMNIYQTEIRKGQESPKNWYAFERLETLLQPTSQSESDASEEGSLDCLTAALKALDGVSIPVSADAKEDA